MASSLTAMNPFASNYWAALPTARRSVLLGTATLIALVVIASALWLLRDPSVSLEAGLSPQRLALLTAELDRGKLPYKVGEDGASIEVPQSRLGQARAAASGGTLGLPNSVGLELFKDNDFSATDFAQRMNYQRALQGELTRTIQTLAGVRSARVHVILPEAGLLRRSATKATAAVGIAMGPGRSLARSQVLGIQRLVAASVPDIKLEDIVVFDESGASLTRSDVHAEAGAEASPSSSQLELKREVDTYLEGKLRRLLDELAPSASSSLSVDTTLDYKQSRVTTEEPIGAPGPKDAEHLTGVVVKERQAQRTSSGMLQTGGDAAGPETSDWEYEYKVGHRVEQTLLAPGSIRRISVAVALHGAPADLSPAALEQFVSHGVGLDRARGDSVTVLLLPAATPVMTAQPLVARTSRDDERFAREPLAASLAAGPALIAAVAAALLGAWAVAHVAQRRAATRERGRAAPGDVDAAEAQIRRWLAEEGRDEPT